jgi:hypothetical protein
VTTPQHLKISMHDGEQEFSLALDRVSHDERAFVLAIIHGLHRLPAELVLKVRAEVARYTKPLAYTSPALSARRTTTVMEALKSLFPTLVVPGAEISPFPAPLPAAPKAKSPKVKRAPKQRAPESSEPVKATPKAKRKKISR